MLKNFDLNVWPFERNIRDLTQMFDIANENFEIRAKFEISTNMFEISTEMWTEMLVLTAAQANLQIQPLGSRNLGGTPNDYH